MPRATVTGGLPASDPLAGGFFANADLTTIRGPGTPDPTGDVGLGAIVWAGEASGYLTRINRTVIERGQQVTVLVDVFQVPWSAAQDMLAAAGPDWTASTVTITDRRTPTGGTLVWRVNAMELRVQNTILDHVRLELEHGVPA